MEQRNPGERELLDQYRDDRLIKQLQKRIRDNEETINDYLEQLGLTNEGFLPRLLECKALKHRSKDDEDEFDQLLEVFTTKRQTLISQAEIASRVLQLKFDKWRQNGATVILFEISKTQDKFNTDQSKKQLLHIINMSFQHLVEAYKNIFDFVRAAREREDNIKVEFQDEQIKLELILRMECDELDIQPCDVHKEYFASQRSSWTDQNRLNKLKELTKMVDKIRDLNPIDMEAGQGISQDDKLHYTEFLFDKEVYQRLESMPLCFELVLFRLILYLSIKIHDPPKYLIDNLNVVNIDKDIIEDMKSLHQLLIPEDYSKETAQKLSRIAHYDQGNKISQKQLYQNLKNLRYELVNFNFSEFFELYRKTTEAAQKISGKDVYVLLGSTGTGKSTTLQYLFGSKMIRQTIQGLKHIAATEIKIPELMHVSLSPHTKSETRYVTPIETDLKMLGYHYNRKIIMVDTPGCEDTDSQEVNLSNCIGINEAIKGAKSVVPIILFSYKNLGARFDKIKANIKYYSQMIKNVKLNIEMFNFFFTHMPEDQDEKTCMNEIVAMFQNGLRHLNDQENNDQIFKEIFSQILYKAENNNISIVRPLDQNFLGIWKNLINSQPIYTPSSVFQMSSVDGAMMKAQSQFDIHENHIINALKRGEMHLAAYKYDELIKFIQIFQEHQNFINRFEKVKDKISQVLNDNFKDGQEALSNLFDSSTNVKFDQMQQKYLVALEYSNKIEPFRIKYFEGSGGAQYEKNIPSYAALISEISTEATKHRKFLPTNDLLNDKWLQFLKKCNPLSQLGGLSNPSTLFTDHLTNYLKLLKENIGTPTQLDIRKGLPNLIHSSKSDLGLEKTTGINFYQPANIKTDSQKMMIKGRDDQSCKEEEKKSSSDSGSNLALPSHENLIEKQIIDNIKILRQVEKKFDIPEIRKYTQELISDILQELQQAITQIQQEELDFIYFTNEEQDSNSSNQKIQLDKMGSKYVLFENYITMLDIFLKYLDDKNLLDIRDYFRKLKKEVTQILLDQFSSYKVIIRGLTQTEATSEFQIKKLFDQMKQLRRITFVQKITDQDFQIIHTQIQCIVKRQLDLIERILITLDTSEKQTLNARDLRQLRVAMQDLKRLSWINQDDQLRTEEINYRIHRQILGIQNNMQDEYIKFNLELGCHSNFSEVATYIITLEDFKKIAEIIDIKLIFSEDIIHEWQRQVKYVFSIIEEQLKFLSQGKHFLTKRNISTIAHIVQYLQQIDQHRKVISRLCADYKDNPKDQIIQIKKGVIHQQEQMIKIINAEIEQLFQMIEKSKSMSNQTLLKTMQETQQQISLEVQRKQMKERIKLIDDAFKILIAIKINLDDEVKIINDSDSKLHEVKETLKGLQEYLFRIIEEDLISEQKLQYRKLIIFLLREFGPLDAYIDEENNKFKPFYDNCIKNSQQDLQGQLQQISQCLNDKEYSKIKQLMDELTGPLKDNSIAEKAKVLIFNHISGLIEDTNDKCLKEELTSSELKELNDAMTQMTNIRKYQIEQYAISESQGEISTCFQVQLETTNHLFKMIDNELKNIDQDIKNHCLNEARKKHKIVYQSFASQIKYQRTIFQDQQQQSEELKMKAEQLQSAIESIEQLETKFNVVLQEYNTLEFLSIEQIIKHKPKQIIQELESHSKDNKFKVVIDCIKGRILAFYDGEIIQYKNKISKGDISYELKKSFESLEKSLEFIPEEQKNNIVHFIKEVKSLIEERENLEQENIKKKLQDNQIDSLLEELKQLQFELSDQMKIEINQFASAKFDNISKLIGESITFAFDKKHFGDILLMRDEILVKYFSTSTHQKKQEMIDNIERTFDKMTLSVKAYLSTNELLPGQQNSIEVMILINQLFAYITLYDICKDEGIINYIPYGINKLSLLLQEAHNFLRQVGIDFKTAFDSQPKLIDQISIIVKLASKANVFLQPLQAECKRMQIEQTKYGQPAKVIFAQIEELSTIKIYKEICDSINSLINDIIGNIKNIQSLTQNEKTRHNHKDRQLFYSQIEQSLQVFDGLMECQQDLQNMDLKNLKNQSIKEFEIKMQELNMSKQEIQTIFLNDQNNEGLQKVGLVYENLTSIAKFCPTFAAKAKQDLESTKIAINQVLDELFNQSKLQIMDAKNLSSCLNKIQRVRIHTNIEDFRKPIEDGINTILGNLNQNNMVLLNSLIIELKSKAEGNDLVSSNPYFKGYEIAMMNKRVASVSIETVLQQLRGDNLDTVSLLAYYSTFRTEYDSQIKCNLIQNMDLSLLVAAIKDISTKYQGVKLSISQLNQIPLLVARIFALWTLMRSDAYFKMKDLAQADLQAQTTREQEQEFYLLQPHPAQVISIFRTLCLGFQNYSFNKSLMVHPIKKKQQEIINDLIVDNLVQIKTGEGKSVTLAVVSMIFALWGFDISCACYSSYLSQRDYYEFQDMFQKLNLTPYIFYGTFNQICERYINKDGSVRDLVLNRILNNHQAMIEKCAQNRPQVLMIDEVDVFFSKEFYNQSYTPIAEIKNPAITELFDYLWNNRNNQENIMFNNVIKSQPFLKSKSLFKTAYQPVFVESVKSMLQDLKDYSTHEYQIYNGMIGYKNQDAISTNIRFGYKTLFSYYAEASKGRLMATAVDQCKSVILDCAMFSYAEIPQYFGLTLGVTGTLEELSVQEQQIVSEVFQIKNYTYTPSVYGQSRLVWLSEKQPVLIEMTVETYYMLIVENMKSNLQGTNGSRSCIIFFESQKKLDQFKESPQFALYKSQCQILNEQVDDSEKCAKVATATYPNKITLATRAFGRGTDFICRDNEVKRNGGVHVIQTFLSEQKTEFIQIQGRTARQGEQGSYILILLAEDLKSFDIDIKQIQDNRADLVKFLEEKRDFKIKNQQRDDTQGKKELTKQHDLSLEIKEQLVRNQGSDEQIKKFLINNNRGPAVANVVKTLILMDATGSMSQLISKTKNAVGVMFERARDILQGRGLEPDLFLIQFACYRNYSSGPNEILEYSPWDSKPQNLRAFMDRVNSSGGQGNEAVEIGLWHANQEAEHGKNSVPLAQIFLIGDMPPNKTLEITQKRDCKFKWENTKYAKTTFYKNEIANLKQHDIPVFGFYVNSAAQKKFTWMAEQTGGACQFLDVNNEEKGQKQLTDFFVTRILKKIGIKSGDEELGDLLVNDYKKKFGFVQ